MISTARSNYPEILKKILLPILELLPFFSSNFQNFNTFRFLFQKLYEIDVKFKQQTCAACEDIHALQF
jgi:hypothetical protein